MAALDSVEVRRVSAAVRIDAPAPRRVGEDGARLLHGLMLERAAADRAGEAAFGDDHPRARAARRRAFGGEDGDQSRRPLLQRRPRLPGPVSHCAP